MLFLNMPIITLEKEFSRWHILDLADAIHDRSPPKYKYNTRSNI